jgi:hypothetical protein
MLVASCAHLTAAVLWLNGSQSDRRQYLTRAKLSAGRATGEATLDNYSQCLLNPLLVGVLAGLGYVAKLIIEAAAQCRRRGLQRQARLVTLQSQLLASRKVFEIQHELVKQLSHEIKNVKLDICESTYDEILAAGYPHLDDQQKLVHGLIRAYRSTRYGR